MSIFAEVSSDPNDWFEAIDKNSVRSALSGIQRSLFLLNSDVDFRRKCLSNLASVVDFSSREILQSLILEVPYSRIQPFVDADLRVGAYSIGRTTFDLANQTDQLARLNLTRVKSDFDELREVVFDRVFRNLARQATSIEICDRYAVDALSSGYNGRWFLKRLLEESTAPIAIYSEMRKDNPSKLHSKLEEPLANLIAEKKDSNTSVSVMVYQNVYHNRRIHFSFTGGALSLNLELGMNTFSRPKMEEDMDFLISSSNLFEQRTSRIKSQLPLAWLMV